MAAIVPAAALRQMPVRIVEVANPMATALREEARCRLACPYMETDLQRGLPKTAVQQAVEPAPKPSSTARTRATTKSKNAPKRGREATTIVVE